MNVYNWQQLDEHVKKIIKSVQESEFQDKDFIDVMAGRMADVTLIIGEKGYMLFDKTIAKDIINASIKKT